MLKYHAAFLLLSISSSPPHAAGTGHRPACSLDSQAAGMKPVAPIPAPRQLPDGTRGEACTLRTVCLHSPRAAGQLSTLFFQNAKEKHRTAPLTGFSPPSRIPLAARIRPSQGKKNNQTKKTCSLTLHPSSSVFLPAKEPRSDMEKLDKKKGGLFLMQQTLEGQKTQPCGLEDVKGVAELSPKLAPVTGTQRPAIQRTSYAQLTTPEVSFPPENYPSLP